MTDLEKILMTAALTICGGVFVYVCGQLLSKFFIEPLYELRKAMGEARFNLAFHATTIHTPIARAEDNSEKAREALMKSSSDLVVKLHAIPFYGAMSTVSFGVLPSPKAIEDAAVQFRGLSTYVHEDGQKAIASLGVISQRVEKIEKLLGFAPLK